MSSVKIDLERKARRLEETYPSDTPSGVIGLLLNRNEVREEAIRSGNFAAVDALVDLEDAMENASLSEREREVVDLVDRWSVEEIAGTLGITDSATREFLRRGAEKLSAYLTSGANDER